jgi:hypothetical protein
MTLAWRGATLRMKDVDLARRRMAATYHYELGPNALVQGQHRTERLNAGPGARS